MPVSTAVPCPPPQHTASTLPGRIDQPQAAMMGPSLGPRPAALPTDTAMGHHSRPHHRINPAAGVTMIAPSAVSSLGGRHAGGAAIPHPAALAAERSTDFYSDSIKSSSTTRPYPHPADPFAESVYKLIAEEIPPAPHNERYRSRFAQRAHEEYQSNKKAAASMGPAKVPVPDPRDFLKRRERETGAGLAPAQHPDRAIRKAPLPDKPGKIPPTTQKDFIRSNALDNINSLAKRPPSPPAPYLSKKCYGQIPPFLRDDPSATLTPHISQKLHQQSHIKADSTPRNSIVARQLQREQEAEAMRRGEYMSSQPPMVQMPEAERLEILGGLQKNWDRLNSDYQKLSLTVDTVPKIARKVNMEQQLKDLEDNIHKFSHPKIFVDLGSVYAR
ncbi:calmodulin-binding-domain-containing protein [Phlyctochytrium arcticum]|nr:calmodulin-binding-domain-containing protein [Phlyctochytrium arcticum]